MDSQLRFFRREWVRTGAWLTVHFDAWMADVLLGRIKV